MKYALLAAVLSFISYRPSCAQEFTDSNLPIVIITTISNAPIVDNPRIIASMKIIDRGNGDRNYMTDQDNPAFLNYNGKIEIELRGSSTQTRPKKQYGFSTLLDDDKTNNNVSLLGMPQENDWILNGMVFDPSLMRDYISYNLSRQIGEYASRTAYCELIINGTYKGLYVLQEKIKSDYNRVDISNISKTDNSLPNLSGGYITKADKTTGGDPIAWTLFSTYGVSVGFIHEQPNPEDVTTVQTEYIRMQYQLFETAAYYGNNSVTNGIPSYIDIPSFIDYMLICELSSNADSYMFSTFFHKDRNGKLRAGPIWDFDLTYGNDIFIWGFDRSKTNVWQFSNGDNEGARFWRDLFRNDLFRCYLSKRWYELTKPGQPLNLSSLELFIDETKNLINEAAIRDNALWSSVGNLQEQVNKIKTFLKARIEWMNGNLGAYSECANVPVPPLVISKIMFHPQTSVEFPDDAELEFIEIKNNGDRDISLEGIYFSGTGFVYQFPFYSTMKSHSSLVLASNLTAFRTKYRTNPYSQFTRHLSNKSQKLVLSDGYGNVIDEVQYSDTVPWPEADGNGKYLKLINPNPVADVLRIESKSEIRQISLYDISGRVLCEVSSNLKSVEFDMHTFPGGIYIIKVSTADKAYSKKIIKY
jgi:hypothetical protein